LENDISKMVEEHIFQHFNELNAKLK